MKIKKKLIYISTTLLIGAAYYCYYSWNEAQKEALKWLEDKGVQTVSRSNTLVEKLPDNLKFLEKLFGKDIKSLDLSPGNREFDFDPLDGPYGEKTLEPIKDISILERFSSLKELSLANTEVSDISVLKHLKNLKSLNLSGTLVSDLSALKALKNLESLDLSNLRIKELTVLRHLTKLKQLILSESVVIDITALKDLKSLESLNLSETVFKELPKLGNLTNLKLLSLRNTQIIDISVLKTLPAIEEINLALTDVTDLRPLYGLKALDKINLKITRINSEQVKELQKHLPRCQIRDHINSEKVNNYLNRSIPRLKFNDESIRYFFKVLGEESIRADPEYICPLIYRTKEYREDPLHNFMSLDLEDLTMGEIIHTVCKYKGLHYKIEKHAVIVYHPSALTKAERAPRTINLGKKVIPLSMKNSKIEQQLEKIIIPKVRFEDRDAAFIIDFIKRTSRDLSDDQIGINILSMIKPNLKVNLDRDNVSVKEVLKNICKQLNVKYHLEANTVILEPK